MGDMYDAHQALADQYAAGLVTADGTPVDAFDLPDGFGEAADGPAPAVRKKDPARPEAVYGRYKLPNPETGKTRSFQRVTNFVKMTDDTYQLELWKQRNVAKGVALLARDRAGFLADLSKRDVKLDREYLNRVVENAQDAAEAYKMADEGTALHTSTELYDYAGGDLSKVPEHHRRKVAMYGDALAAKGLTVLPDMIERVVVSTRYETAGKLDRLYGLRDGTAVVGDLKTGDSLDLSAPSIAAQLQCYEDGVNAHGIFTGDGYDTSIKVRTDFAIVVHLPSTRDEVHVYKIDLAEGRKINDGNLHIKAVRKIKARHVMAPFEDVALMPSGAETTAHWYERLNAAWTVPQLVEVADAARGFGQWNEALAKAARRLAEELKFGGRH